jgi:hypothetical protein
MVATDSTVTGTWQRYGDLAPSRLVRSCPKGATLFVNARECKNAAGTAFVMTFSTKAAIDAAQLANDALGTADLSWTAPQTNTDDSALTDLSRFLVFAAPTSPPERQIADLDAATLRYHATGLSPGVWYFAIKAKTARGVESALSAIVSKTIAAIVRPTVTLSIAPTDGVEKVTPRLIWSSSNAEKCAANGAWSGDRAKSGDEVGADITSNATYEIVCIGPGGEARVSVSVTVSPRPNAPASLIVQ